MLCSVVSTVGNECLPHLLTAWVQASELERFTLTSSDSG